MPDNNPSLSVLVIGAGIVGASIAFHLADQGAQVHIIDQGNPGHGASAVSFAWINARDKNPRPYQDLNRRSMEMWDRFARRLGGDIGLTWGGELRWVATLAGAQALADRVNTLQSWGYPIQLLSEQGLIRLEPGITPGRVTGVSYSNADGHVDTQKVIRACLDGTAKRGAVVSAGMKAVGLEVSGTGSDSNTVSAVLVGGQALPCDVVVLAGGPDSAELARQAGITVPASHTFGATVITAPVQPLLNNAAVVHTPPDQETQIALRQLADGSVMLHGGDGGTLGESLGKSDAEIQRIIKAAGEYFHLLKNVPIKEVRTGRRPMPADGQSILGFTQAVPNLYLAITHSGVTLAPLIGEFAALEIITGARIDLLTPYRLERFQS